MKLISSFCVAIVLLMASTVALGQNPQDENMPWTGVVTFCDSDELSVLEVRQACADFWYAAAGLEILPPVVVTFCPPDHATDNALNNGNKPMFTPNGFCPLECPEGTVEIVCTIMRWEE